MGILEILPSFASIFKTVTTQGPPPRSDVSLIYEPFPNLPFLQKVFILDERSYPTDSVVDPALKETQGPALIAVNDGLLRDVDWTALRKINSSSKGFDETYACYLYLFKSVHSELFFS